MSTATGTTQARAPRKPPRRRRAGQQLKSVQEIAAERKRGRMGMLLILPGMIYLAVFFVAPVVVLLSMSLFVKPEGGEIGEFVPGWDWANYSRVLGAYWPVLLRSFFFAGLATIFALLIGYPMAYLVAVRLRGRPLLQGILLVLLIAPFFSSFILRTQSWKQILSDEGPVAGTLKFLHLLPPDGHLTATAFAVVCGLTYNFLPFMMLPIYSSLDRLDTRLLEASGDLYSSPFQTFRHVTLPQSMPGVFAGTLLTFIPASGDYVNAALLGNNRDTSMIGQIIDSRFFRVVDYPGAAALSFVLMVCILVLVLLYMRRFGTDELF